jgi:hypothetical protein
MNSPVAPLSTSAVTELLSTVSVVSISTFNFGEVGFPSVAATVNFLGSSLSHSGRWSLAQKFVTGVKIKGVSGFCTSWVFISMSFFIFSMFRTLKQLQEDNEGMLFIYSLRENPGLEFLLPQWMGSPLLAPRLFWQA